MPESTVLVGSADRNFDHNPGPIVFELDDASCTEILNVLSSSTAREVFQSLRESPAYPVQIAASTNETTQNVHYHLQRLKRVDLIEVIDTVYSSKGRKMKVYAATGNPILLTWGDIDQDELCAPFVEP